MLTELKGLDMTDSETLNKKNEIVELIVQLEHLLSSNYDSTEFSVLLNRVIIICEENDIDEIELAKELGITLQTIVSWSNYFDHPSYDVARIVCKRLIKMLNRL